MSTTNAAGIEIDFKGKQQTIVIHVDDILATCELEEANQQLIDALKSTYEQIGT